jgi:hypothetical protein
MFYIKSHKDPKEIKKELEGSKVRCDVEIVSKDNIFLLCKGSLHEISIVNANYHLGEFGISWTLDIIYYDDLVPDVIIVDVDLIKDFCEQVEGTNTVKSLREEYVITDEELDEIIEDINLWSVIDSYEEKIDDLKELDELSESQQKELDGYNEKLKELLKKVKQ